MAETIVVDTSRQLRKGSARRMNPISEVLTVGRQTLQIAGFVASGYEPVLDAFKGNFVLGRELGAACSAYVDGQCIMDLWGGYRTPEHTDPWHADTMALVMSTTKGLSAMTLAVAHSRGLLDYEAPVVVYWPEFGQNGKSRVTVRELLAHQAGICAIDTPLTLPLLRDHDALADVLARQRPAWEPGTRHGYHPTSLGLYESELLRRVDPKHRTLGKFFSDEVAVTLGGDMYIGLPADIGEERLAGLKIEHDMRAMTKLPLRFFLDAFNPRSLVSRVARNPKIKRIDEVNTRPYLEIELPSVNGVATARAIASAYGDFASGGRKLGINEATLELLEQPAVAPSMGTVDVLYRIDFAYSLGFCKPFPTFPFSDSRRAYGTPGAGGSQGFADPSVALGFAYVPNLLRVGGTDDPRAASVRHALYSCLLR